MGKDSLEFRCYMTKFVDFVGFDSCDFVSHFLLTSARVVFFFFFFFSFLFFSFLFLFLFFSFLFFFFFSFLFLLFFSFLFFFSPPVWRKQ